MANPSFVYDDSFWSGFEDGAQQGLEQQSNGTWEWIANNGDDAISLLNGVICTIKPDRPGCPGSVPPGGAPFYRRDNTPMYILIAIVVILALIIIFKK